MSAPTGSEDRTESGTGNVDADEISHFNQFAANWWDPHGEMAPLHALNPVRLAYVIQRCGPLTGRGVLDVGCGGGLLTEALAREGAQVTGIDLAGQALEVARRHTAESRLTIDYRLCTAEALAEESPQAFDIVCCMEMLEHVPNPAAVVAACAALSRPGGQVVLSTINRNPKSFVLAIVAAEHLLRLLPAGTHDYAKLIRPSELDEWARSAGLEPRHLAGLRYNPLLKIASLHPRDIGINYLMHCVKPKPDDRA